MHVAVIGATGRTGRRVAARLCARGHAVTALGLTPAKLGSVDRRARTHAIDLVAGETRARLGALLAPAEIVVSCAHARFTDAILAALPARGPRLVLMGSVRRYLPIPDRDGAEIATSEHRFQASGRPGVMLHASMIFGTADDGNVSRVLRLLSRWPRAAPIVLPLPDGGRRLVQPIFIDDVADAVVAAVERPTSDGPPIVLAGPNPIAYRQLIEHCAAALGRRARIAAVPLGVLVALAAIAAGCRLRLPLDAAELRRASQDKAFDIAPMIERLGVHPVDFATGLARMRLATPD